MKIYTKTGDKGKTKLPGGFSVNKDSDRVESYGTIDELNSWVGYCAALLKKVHPILADELQTIQNYLFDCGTDLAITDERNRSLKLPKEATKFLEERIDVYTSQVKELETFILPGGSEIASALQVARAITRRAERRIVRLTWTSKIDPEIIVFINRLSDYFFALSRLLNKLENVEEPSYVRGVKVFH
ncbi:MAG: cob(I)yrinic acid a,c-diamide adenosyltransferase [Lactobacillales bacterium]|jgi:cob(I)alamin adenosyltransferase|nr:cob(I)yrinic acid a,c-diamide adenosyltransferase [Lactobacillales bacterium]